MKYLRIAIEKESTRHFRIGYAWPLIDELKDGLDCLLKVLRESI